MSVSELPPNQTEASINPSGQDRQGCLARLNSVLGRLTERRLRDKKKEEWQLPPEQINPIQVSADTLQYTELDQALRTCSDSLGITGRHYLSDDYNARIIVEEVARGIHPDLSQIVSHVYHYGKADHLFSLINADVICHIPGTEKASYEIYYSFNPFDMPSQENLFYAYWHAQLEREPREWLETGRSLAPSKNLPYDVRVKESLESPTEWRNLFTYGAHLRKERLTELKHLLDATGISAELKQQLFHDEQVDGKKLLAVTILAQTLEQIAQRQGTHTVLGDEVELIFMQNPKLLFDTTQPVYDYVRSYEDSDSNLRHGRRIAAAQNELKQRKESIVGQDINLKPGTMLIIGGGNDRGKTIALQSSVGSIILNNLGTHQPAEKVLIPQTSKVVTTAPKVRTLHSWFGSDLELELKDVIEQLRTIPISESSIIQIYLDDLFQTSDADTAVALIFALRDYIYSRNPNAIVAAITHNSMHLFEAVQRDSDRFDVEGKIKFAYVDADRQLKPYTGGDTYEGLLDLTALATNEGRIVESMRGPKQISDVATLNSLYRPKQWIGYRITDNDLVCRVARGDLSSWIELSTILRQDPDMSQDIRSRKASVRTAEKLKKFNRGFTGTKKPC